jgi:hypothetical protein
MHGFILKFFLIVTGVLLMLYLIGQVARSARRLDRRIQEFKSEQEENEKSGKVLNPYAALAELYAEEAKPARKPPRRAGRRRR